MDVTEACQDMFKEIFGGGLFGILKNLLTQNPETVYPTAWSLAQTIYNNVMVPIALGLMVIFFLVKLMERSTMEQVTIEQVLVLFVKLLAAKFLIDYGFEIFSLLWSLGLSLVNEFAGALSGGTGASNPGLEFWNINPNEKVISNAELKELWKDYTGYEWDKKMGWSSLGPFVQLLIPWIAAQVLKACAYFICYSRLIEMFIRVCGAPIALSDFMTEGMQGAGWRYLKSFLAICLQGLMILLVARIYSILMYDVITGQSGFAMIVAYLAVSFSAIALMFKSLSLAKELVGAA